MTTSNYSAPSDGYIFLEMINTSQAEVSVYANGLPMIKHTGNGQNTWFKASTFVKKGMTLKSSHDRVAGELSATYYPLQ